MTRHLVIVIFSTFLASYASNSTGSENYIYKIKKGAKFVLKQDITIAARDAHVLLQDGKIKQASNVDKYASFCRLEVNNIGAQTIKPDNFTVSKVTQHEPEVLPYVYHYYVKFDLRSKQSPDVRSLDCGAWGSNTDTYITYHEMQQALGNYFQIPKPK